MTSRDPAVPQKRLPERDSYGWLAQSSVQPSKRRAIDGVSASSIVDLQANLYTAKETVQARHDGILEVKEKHVRRRAGIDIGEIIGPRNAGVEARDARDKLHVKSATDRMAECYAALERKAEVYNRLAQGRALDEDLVYEVDFQRKTMEGGGPEPPRDGYQADRGEEEDFDRDGEREAAEREERRAREAREEAEREQLERRRQYKEDVLEVAGETRESREKAALQRQRRDTALQQRRDRVKAAFLQRQLARPSK